MNKESFPLSPLEEINALKNSALYLFCNDLRQGETLIPPAMTMQPQRYPHRKAILIVPTEPSGRWYVQYYIYNQTTGKLVRKRKYKKFNSLPNDEARRKYGKQLCVKINELLQYAAIGVPESIDKNETKKTYSLKKAVDYILQLKYPITKNRKTYLTFSSVCARFEVYCANSGISTQNVTNITRDIAQTYIDFLATSGISPNTVENQFNVFRLIWNQLLKRNIVEINPWIGADRPQTVESDRNIAYSLEEQAILKEKIQNEAPKVWNIVKLLYYCFIRESEISRLRVKDIDLQHRKVFIPGTNAKNKKRDFVTMPASIVEMFLQMNLQNYPADYFVFTSELQPGIKQAYSSAYYKKYKKLLDQTGITGKTLYSWKHTGAVAAHQAGVNIKFIQLQCRHSNIEQTDTYLKSLGMRENTEFIEGIPDL